MVVKRMTALILALGIFWAILPASSLAYSKNSQGLYVDDNGNVIEELWDDDAGIYIVNGVEYSIYNGDDEEASKKANSGSDSTESSATATPKLNEDGGLTIQSGQGGTGETSTESTTGLTPAEWAARVAKYSAQLGVTTGVTYTDDNGQEHAAEIIYVGLGRSTIQVNGEVMLVPTCSIKWDTEAPADQVLAVVTTQKATYATLRAKKSKSSFVMGHCDKCSVLLVISTGKTWTMVDHGGVRGYVLTSALTFYDNEPKNWAAAIITVKGKTPSGNTVHVRSSTQRTARQIAEFDVGTPITVFAQDEKWTEIDVDGLHCYIMNEFVTLQEPLLSEAEFEAKQALANATPTPEPEATPTPEAPTETPAPEVTATPEPEASVNPGLNIGPGENS